MPFDANDPDTKAALKAAIDEALETANSEFDDKSKRLLDDLKKAKADLRKVKDVNPEDVAAIEAERDALATKLAAAERVAKDATTAAEKAAKALEQESGFTQKLLIQDGIKSALLANGVKDEDFIDSLAAKFAPTATITVDGDKREAKIGDKSLADHIKEWASTDAGKKFVSAPVNSGGGAQGGKGGTEGAKSISQGEYDAMNPKARAAHFAAGGVISETA